MSGALGAECGREKRMGYEERTSFNFYTVGCIAATARNSGSRRQRWQL